jgi:hypothetical protein
VQILVNRFPGLEVVELGAIRVGVGHLLRGLATRESGGLQATPQPS